MSQKLVSVVIVLLCTGAFVSANIFEKKCPGQETERPCSQRFSCKYTIVNSEVCAVYRLPQNVLAPATFPNLECLQRSICENKHWSLCHRGPCIPSGMLCETNSTIGYLNLATIQKTIDGPLLRENINS